jgi:hypothetical protein
VRQMRVPSKLFFVVLSWISWCNSTGLAQDSDRLLWAEYEKLPAAIAPAPLFLPPISFWKFAMLTDSPQELQNRLQKLVESARQQNDVRLLARVLVLQGQLETTEQPAALHRLHEARQLSQGIGDDEGTALSLLIESYRQFRAGNNLAARAHLYKAETLYAGMRSPEHDLRCLSLNQLLKMRISNGSELLSANRSSLQPMAEASGRQWAEIVEAMGSLDHSIRWPPTIRGR